MPFKIKERSLISITGVNNYSSSHKEITDAIEAAVNFYWVTKIWIISHSPLWVNQIANRNAIIVEDYGIVWMFVYSLDWIIKYSNLDTILYNT